MCIGADFRNNRGAKFPTFFFPLPSPCPLSLFSLPFPQFSSSRSSPFHVPLPSMFYSLLYFLLPLAPSFVPSRILLKSSERSRGAL